MLREEKIKRPHTEILVWLEMRNRRCIDKKIGLIFIISELSFSDSYYLGFSVKMFLPAKVTWGR